MKQNELILKVGIILIIFTALLSSGITYFTKLNNPIFYRYCIEVPIPEQGDIPNSQFLFELNYFTSISDNSSVIDLSFPDAPEMDFSVNENGYAYNATFDFQNRSNTIRGNQYGKYRLRTVNVFLDYFDQPDWTGEKEVHEATIQFSNGNSMKVDLGTIIFYRDKKLNQDYLMMEGGHSSSDGSASVSFQVINDIEIQYIKSDLLDITKDLVDIKIEGEDAKEILKNGFKPIGSVLVNTHFKELTKSDTNYDVYDIKPKLYFKQPDGTLSYIRIYNINQKRWFYNYKEVLLYLKGRGGF